MNNLISTFVYLVAGFLVGAVFSEHISMNLMNTDWYNLWTYAWVAFWPVLLVLNFFLWVAAIMIVIGLCMIVRGFGIDRGWW